MWPSCGPLRLPATLTWVGEIRGVTGVCLKAAVGVPVGTPGGLTDATGDLTGAINGIACVV